MALLHGQHGQHGQKAAETDGAGGNAALMAAALMRTRDAIVGIEQIDALQGEDSAHPAPERLRRMSREYREAILISEILEDLSFSSTADPANENVARSIRLSRREAGGAAGYRPLVTLIRPDVDHFSVAAPLVAAYAELRADRTAEILVQTQGLLPFFASIMLIDQTRTPAVMEMLETALAITTPVVMRVKLALGCPRPTLSSDRVQPMIAVPAHPTLPSGHATQAFTLATVLSLLQNPLAEVVADSQLYRLACRIAINRTVAGVHFPADSACGAVLGIQLGRHLMARAMQGGPTPVTFRSATWDGTFFHDPGRPRDFHYAILGKMMTEKDDSTSFADDAAAVQPAPLWASLVARASAEWTDRWS